MQKQSQTISCQDQRQQMRRRRTPADYRALEQAQQKVGANPNRSPEAVAEELKRRKLAGQKDARDLDLRGVDTRTAGALDGFDFGGVRTDGKTVIGRAVGAKFDGAHLSGRITGDINGSTMRRARLTGLTAPDINRNGIDESGSVQSRVDFSGGTSIGRKSVNVNAYLVSRDRSDNSGSVTHGGWQTQCFHDDATYNGAKIINTGIGGSSFDRIRGERMEFRPKSKDDNFSLTGAKLTDAKINPLIAIKAFEDNATLTRCEIAHEPEAKVETKIEPKPQAKPFNRFEALTGFHKEAMAAKDMVSSLASFAAHRPRVTSTLGALALGL